MSATPAQLRTRAPEFSSLDDPTIQTFLDDAALNINPTYWGKKADLGTIYLAAHLLTRAYPALATPSGALTSERVGDVARSYAPPALMPQIGGAYSTSRWGMEFQRLLNTLSFRGPQVL